MYLVRYPCSKIALGKSKKLFHNMVTKDTHHQILYNLYQCIGCFFEYLVIHNISITLRDKEALELDRDHSKTAIDDCCLSLTDLYFIVFSVLNILTQMTTMLRVESL